MKHDQVKELVTWMRENGVAQFSHTSDALSVVFSPKAVEIPGIPAPLSASTEPLELAEEDDGLTPHGDDPVYDYGLP